MAVLIDTFAEAISVNDAGVWRVAGSRVSVDSVLNAFNSGATPEEIIWQFDTLELKDVYAVINFYLHNRERVDRYLRDSEKEQQQILRRVRKDFPVQPELLERLRERRRSSK
ncbi:MAG: DUF433 domain-containing protein [Pyrinomonadaceae bacterium]